MTNIYSIFFVFLHILNNILYNLSLQTEESISGLAAMVKELQDYKEHFSEEKKRRVILKQQENERKEQHWNGEISQINQVINTSLQKHSALDRAINSFGYHLY